MMVLIVILSSIVAYILWLIIYELYKIHQKLKITTQIYTEASKLEFKVIDLELTDNEVTLLVNFVGNDWRLPTIDELFVIQNTRRIPRTIHYWVNQDDKLRAQYVPTKDIFSTSLYQHGWAFMIKTGKYYNAFDDYYLIYRAIDKPKCILVRPFNN